MMTVKLIVSGVRKNLRDYLIYFLTLMLAVSLFYAFNAISDQPAFTDIGMTRELLYDQLGRTIRLLSLGIAVVLAFLIIYANQFLLRRRKKELGLYMLLGMRKGRIARIFAGEAFCIGVLALVVGLGFGVLLSQGLTLVALKLFAITPEHFTLVFSPGALRQTTGCFALIFFIVMLCNGFSVVRVQLTDLFTAARRNTQMRAAPVWRPALYFLLALGLCIGALAHFQQHGILPSQDGHAFELALAALAFGTILLFSSGATVGCALLRSWPNFYLKRLNTFLLRQMESKLHSNNFLLALCSLLLAVTICALSIGASTAMAMNTLAEAQTPYDLNVLSDVSTDGDGRIADYLTSQGLDTRHIAQRSEQISIYEADFTYAELFAGQTVALWPIDAAMPGEPVWVITVSDFNRAMAMQGKDPIVLGDDEYLMNCNYEGTKEAASAALADHPTLSLNGTVLHRASETLLEETYFMTSVGNNDRGTLIVPDNVVHGLAKDVNVLLVQYKPATDPDQVLQKLLPIGLDDSHGYRYAEKTMMVDMFYGLNAMLTFLCCYVGLIFMLIGAALLALKQLTETTDNIRRYGLLQKLGASPQEIRRSLLWQTGLFFLLPLGLGSLYAIFFARQGMMIVEEFMNLHIAWNLWLVIALFMIVYTGYFLAAYTSCKHMVTERDV